MMTTEPRPSEYAYNGEYDHICNQCGHETIPIFNVTRNERGWQCLHCGFTFSRIMSRLIHALLRRNVYRYLSQYPSEVRQRMAWFRLPGYKPYHYDPDTGWRVYDAP